MVQPICSMVKIQWFNRHFQWFNPVTQRSSTVTCRLGQKAREREAPLSWEGKGLWCHFSKRKGKGLWQSRYSHISNLQSRLWQIMTLWLSKYQSWISLLCYWSPCQIHDNPPLMIPKLKSNHCQIAPINLIISKLSQQLLTQSNFPTKQWIQK